MYLPLPVLFLITSLYHSPTLALHESDVGVVDWHKTLIGVPLDSTAPVFHRFGELSRPTQSVILTATGNNVLAALNPTNGSVVWRHIYQPEDPVLRFTKKNKVVAALSGPEGSTFRSFDVLTGELLLEKRLRSVGPGHQHELPAVGTAIEFAKENDDNDVFVLSNGCELVRLDSITGKIKWTWVSEDQGSLVIYSKVHTTQTHVYAIGLAKSFASYTIHITSLTQDGTLLATTSIPSSISHPDPLLLLSTKSGSHTRIAWLEQGTLKSFLLSPKLTGKPTTTQLTFVRLLDIGLAADGICAAVKADGSSKILSLSKERSGLKEIWDFQSSGSDEQQPQPIFTGGYDRDGNVYIARMHWSSFFRTASMEVFVPHLADGKGIVHAFTFPFATQKHGVISHIAMDAANPSGWTVFARFVLTTSSGAVQLWHQADVQWTREESLSKIGVAEFVELPEKKVTLAKVEGEEGFVKRLVRQIAEAKGFPQYAVNFVRRFATGSYAATSAATPIAEDGLWRDAFGFRQIIVAATEHGTVFGIDSSNGAILWSRILGHGWAVSVGAKITPLKVYVTRGVGDVDLSGIGEIEGPQVVLVVQRTAENTLVDTVVFHIDALTGEDSRRVSPSLSPLEGMDIVAGPLVDAFFLQKKHKTVLMVDQFLRLHLYPDTFDTQAWFAQIAPALHIPLRPKVEGSDRMKGHQVVFNPALSDKFVAYPTWTLSLPPDEHLQTVIRPTAPHAPVASAGRVLVDRTTLYKYLNPHLFIALTQSATRQSCGIYLVDGVKGSVVYHAAVPSAPGGRCDVKAMLVENWLVYHFFNPESQDGATSKGHEVVTVELYEGQVDQKFNSSDMSSFSSQKAETTILEQTFLFPHGITAISPTITKFGVTFKDIIVATRDHKIYSIPHRLLDPRRPNRKVTTAEQEEYLLSYEPLVDAPQQVLSHMYQVANVRCILTAPALLESTSLVFAHGLDLFFTRVAPSGTFDLLSENFNKAQLIFTVSGLALAIMVTKPMVARKKLRERWYQ